MIIKGFSLSAVAAGIKYQDRLDLGLIYSDAPAVTAGMFATSLGKTAFFGEDANWGRIIAAAGRAGVRFNSDKIDIAFGDVVIVRNGRGLGTEAEEAATRVLKERKFAVCTDLKDGAGCEEIHTYDFSVDYVKINADYRS
jgi:glutamate N-acetyltransferase/amino-acid N-acetyltransferase